jgi:hypothetical protein
MNNLEPRAKIGDVVVIIKSVGFLSQKKVRDGLYDKKTKRWLYACSDERYPEAINIYEDKDILKNLTTNISYE